MSKTNIEQRSQNTLRRLESNNGAYKVHGGADATDRNSETLSQRKAKTLDSLDSAGISSPEKRRKGVGAMLGATVATATLLVGAGPVENSVSDTVDRIDQSIDSHNLPPGGQPLEYRQGQAYEPGTDNVLIVPPAPNQP
jgi:hypothetical protein